MNKEVQESSSSKDWDMVDAVVPPVATTAALTLSVNPRHDIVGTGSGLATTQVCATVAAKVLPDDELERAPVDILVALDVSGSMEGNKLELCKTSIALLMRQLLPRDRFGLVTFSNDAKVEIPLQHMTSQHKTQCLEQIKRLHTLGCTNISAAIGTAIQILQDEKSPNEVRTIFLLTDGHANMGTSQPEQLLQLTRSWLGGKSDGSPPISMHSFGYGQDHNSTLLQQMAECSPGGTYYFVENDSNVSSAFGDALGGVLSVVAQTAILHLSVSEEAKSLGVEIVDVHHVNKAKKEDGSYTVTLGDFYAEETRDVILDVKLACASSVGAPIPHLHVKISFMDTLEKHPATQGPVVCQIARPVGNELSTPSQHVMVQWLRVKTAEELLKAEKLCNEGNLGAARALLDKMLQEIKDEQPNIQSDPLVEQLMEDLNKLKLGMVSHHTYATTGSHTMSNAYRSHQMQRCSAATVNTRNTYRGSMKTAMAKKFTME